MKSHPDLTHTVSIITDRSAFYPKSPPYHPSAKYPEYPFAENCLGEGNPAYGMVRETLHALGMDSENFGTPGWSPFSSLIGPGDTVVIKPNFVQDFHDSGGDINSVITHGSVIRAVLDYVSIALKDKGSVYIADAPMMNSNFDKIIELAGVNEIAEFYRSKTGIAIHIVDLRVMRVDLEDGLVTRRIKLEGDPNGYVVADLAEKSMFSRIEDLAGRLRGSDYDVEETLKHHNRKKNEYLVSRTVMDADLFINIPKFKTHKKAGVTLSLKNLIGINGDKNWIPHYRMGGPNKSGDEFNSTSSLRHIESILKENFKKFAMRYRRFNPITKKIRKFQKYLVDNHNLTPIRGGAWHGNDTIWRSIIDLNLILMHWQENGSLDPGKTRKYFSLIDGIIAGERNGPMNPKPRNAGTIIAGFSPLTVDFCATRLMGLDWQKIPLMKHSMELGEYFGGIDPASIEVRSNVPEYINILSNNTVRADTLSFEPADGWIGKIELDDPRKALDRTAS